MRKHEQIEILTSHLADQTRLFISYLQTVLNNQDDRFWDTDDSPIKAFSISYAHEDLLLYCSLWDEDMDDCDENEELSFFYELYLEENELEDAESFLPEALREIDLDLEIYERFEEWIRYCWKAARPAEFDLPGFLNEDDSADYRNLDTGEKGDHVYVMEVIAPEEE